MIRILAILFSIIFVSNAYGLTYLSITQDKLQTKVAQEDQKNHQLTEVEAIALAEDFIVKNGYTNLPPVEKDKITPELYDKLVTFETVMKLRHNSLQPKAYGLIRNRRGVPGWTIIFARIPSADFDPKNGRGVSMDLEGKHLFMEPREFPLSTIDKKIEVENKETK